MKRQARLLALGIAIAIAAILGTLDVVPRGQVMHRNLTPFNVFVCNDEAHKLGDFGSAIHQAS